MQKRKIVSLFLRNGVVARTNGIVKYLKGGISLVAWLCAAVVVVPSWADVTAIWTGAGDRGNVNDPANWLITGGDNVIPDANTRIEISGETDFNCPLGQSLAYREIVLSNITLTANCDWRGLTVLASDYIDVSAGAYIDTGFKPNQNTRVVMDVTVQKQKTEYWFGMWNAGYKNGAFAVGNDPSCLYVGFGNAYGGTTLPVVPTGRHTLDFDKGVFKVDGTQCADLSAQTLQANYSLYLFAQNRKGVATPGPEQVSIRCHSCQIYDGETRVRNYVPAFNGLEFGFYEVESGTFVSKLGDGVFSGELTAPAIDGTVNLSGHSLKLADAVGAGTITDSRAYIDAPSGAYVDTGFKPNQNTRVVMDVTVQEQETEYWFGMWNAGYSNGAFAVGNDPSCLYVGFGNAFGGTTLPVVPTGRHTLDFDKGVFKVDGTQRVDLSAQTLQANYSLYLFAQNRKGVVTPGPKQIMIRCHSCQIYDNGTLVRDYSPAFNGVEYGFYERIGGTFAGNRGTGALTGSIPSSELHIDVTTNRTVVNTTLTISGALKLVKDGAGTLVGAKTQQGYTGGTVVSNGIAKSGANIGPWGMTKSLITVADGAAFDWAGMQSTTGTPIASPSRAKARMARVRS